MYSSRIEFSRTVEVAVPRLVDGGDARLLNVFWTTRIDLRDSNFLSETKGWCSRCLGLSLFLTA